MREGMVTSAELWASALQQHKTGNLAAAEELYRRILAIEPTHPDTLHNLGLLAHQLGQHQLAAQYIRRALAFKPTEASFHLNLGVVCQHLGNWDEACACYGKAIRYRPDYADAHFYLGNALDKLTRYEEAIACYRQAVRCRPNYAEAYNNMGAVYRQLRRLDDALACFHEAVRLRPDFAEAHNNLGAVHKVQNRPEEAFASFQEALRLKPAFARAHHNLGSLLSQQGRLQEAADAYQRALQLDPKDASARFLLAALTGADQPLTAPREYVIRLFDGYSVNFDHQLLSDLSYQGPRLLREALGPDHDTKALDILDLGCGTGLSGLACQDLARTLTGVDLSPLMLEHARARGIYHKLIEGDVFEALEPAVANYDVILAGDMFIYLGDLTKIFPAAQRALRPGGRFVFDVEAYDQPGFALRASARYAHSLEYIRALTSSCGLVELSCKEDVLRVEHGRSIACYVFVLQKP
jgi:predicted TPR repeat methyltransferase